MEPLCCYHSTSGRCPAPRLWCSSTQPSSHPPGPGEPEGFRSRTSTSQEKEGRRQQSTQTAQPPVSPASLSPSTETVFPAEKIHPAKSLLPWTLTKPLFLSIPVTCDYQHLPSLLLFQLHRKPGPSLVKMEDLWIPHVLLDAPYSALAVQQWKN